MQKVFIDQSDQHKPLGFGDVIRSSGVFYYRKDDHFNTTITFMNYWAAKRGLQVTVMASLRSMSGELIKRERLSFEDGQVINYSPEPPTLPFEGSVEIEIFALENMAIPFAAINVVYETENSISLTHNYTRTYSPHEIEEGRTISNGEESCWTIRDGNGVRSFAVFHNGLDQQPAQVAKLVLTKNDGSKRPVDIEIPELAPFATFKFTPADYVDDLDAFLDNEPANASFSFKVKKAFTRMLIGNEQPEMHDIQVTHSNFNYSQHATNSVKRVGSKGWMQMPSASITGRRLRIYPDSDPGEYIVATPSGEVEFATGKPIDMPMEGGPISFAKKDGELPTRIVTAIVGDNDEGMIPFELSLGIMHEDRPPKRMWWAPMVSDQLRTSSLIATKYSEIYGDYENQDVIVRIYANTHQDYLEKTLTSSEIERLDAGVPFAELFPDLDEFLGGQLGWFTFYSEYGGFQVIFKLAKRQGSCVLEHGF